MKQIQVKPRQGIPLGHRGENEAREIIFDLTEYINTYGPGTARLLHQRDGDPAPYIVPAVQDGDALTWTVTDEDTAAPGTGSAELQWTVNNVLAKSDIWNTKTKAALDDGATAPPTGAEGWYQQLIAYIDSLRGAGVTPEQIAAAVEAYLLEHPVDIPVDSVNGKTGEVVLTAADVGALALADLQAGVDTALAQAKASGEFDGPQGPAGPAGADGAAGADGKSAYQYAVDGGYAGTETEFAAKMAVENIPAPATAEAGQTIVVKSVDADGKPTEWEAADASSGGIDISRDPDLITEVAEAVTQLSISEINGVPINTTEMVVLWEHPSGAQYIPNYFRFNNAVINGTVITATLANWNFPAAVCPTTDKAAAILSRVKKVNNGVYYYEFSGVQQNAGTVTGASQPVYGGPYSNIIDGETSIKEFFVYQGTKIQPGCKVSVWVK